MMNKDTLKYIKNYIKCGAITLGIIMIACVIMTQVINMACWLTILIMLTSIILFVVGAINLLSPHIENKE